MLRFEGFICSFCTFTVPPLLLLFLLLPASTQPEQDPQGSAHHQELKNLLVFIRGSAEGNNLSNMEHLCQIRSGHNVEIYYYIDI